MRRSLKKQKDNEFHFTYLSSFSIGKKKIIVRNVEGGPFGVGVIYETTNVERRLVITRVVHPRDVSHLMFVLELETA